MKNKIKNVCEDEAEADNETSTIINGIKCNNIDVNNVKKYEFNKDEIKEEDYKKVKRLIINDKLKINQNPFEEIKYLKTEVKSLNKNEKMKKGKISLQKLKKSNLFLKKPKNTEKTQILTFDILQNIKIFSKKELFFLDLKYYIFPLNQNIINQYNDENTQSIITSQHSHSNNQNSQNNILFKMNYEAFLKALRAVYLNYKKFNNFFVVKIDEKKLIFFYKEIILATSNLSSILKIFDIKFYTNNNNGNNTGDGKFNKYKNYLILNDSINIIIDMISNINLGKSKKIPFILSYDEFNFGISQSIKIELKKMVTISGQKEYYYSSNGVIFTGDSKFYDVVSNNIDSNGFICCSNPETATIENNDDEFDKNKECFGKLIINKNIKVTEAKP